MTSPDQAKERVERAPCGHAVTLTVANRCLDCENEQLRLLLEARDRVLGELRQALALARGVIFAEEEMSVEAEHIIDAALALSNQGGEAVAGKSGSDETRPTLSPSDVARIEQRLENEQVNRLRREGRCPVCGGDEPE